MLRHASKLSQQPKPHPYESRATYILWPNRYQSPLTFTAGNCHITFRLQVSGGCLHHSRSLLILLRVEKVYSLELL